jgi:hypothetical protein
VVGAKSICDRGIMIRDPNLELLFRPTSIAIMEALEDPKRVACLPLKYTPDHIGVEEYPITKLSDFHKFNRRATL